MSIKVKEILLKMMRTQVLASFQNQTMHQLVEMVLIKDQVDLVVADHKKPMKILEATLMNHQAVSNSQIN